MNDTNGKRTIRIATRESQLALWQANFVAEQIRSSTGAFSVELVPVSTIGDRDRSGALSQMGGVGVFTREVQRVVLDNAADVAVHSLKDLPTDPVEGLTLAGVPSREARFDALILPVGADGDLDSLPEGARIGTGSLRRQAQLLQYRSDLEMCEIRGNIETRLKKLDSGDYDAIILAEAGLRRIGLDDRINCRLSPPVMYPAVGQAALGIECRCDDHEVIELLRVLSDPETQCEVTAERACLATLRAGCHAPVGTMSTIIDGELQFEAIVLSPDGRRRFDVSISDVAQDAEAIGARAARSLVDAGASEVLAANE